MINLIEKIRQHGLAGSARKGSAGSGENSGRAITRGGFGTLRATPAHPTPDELAAIERDLHGLGIRIDDYAY